MSCIYHKSCHFRFWQARAVESFLRGTPSYADQVFLLRRGLLEVSGLDCEWQAVSCVQQLCSLIHSFLLSSGSTFWIASSTAGARPMTSFRATLIYLVSSWSSTSTPSKDSTNMLTMRKRFGFESGDLNSDMLVHQYIWNLTSVSRLSQFQRFLTQINSSLVDSNMLVRCIVLSLDRFESQTKDMKGVNEYSFQIYSYTDETRKNIFCFSVAQWLKCFQNAVSCPTWLNWRTGGLSCLDWSTSSMCRLSHRQDIYTFLIWCWLH